MILDVFTPRIDKLSSSIHDWYEHKVIPRKGRQPLRVMAAREYLPDRQLLHFVLSYRDLDQNEKEICVKDVNMRVFFPEEFMNLLYHNGWNVKHRFGDYDESDFQAKSPKQILVCTKR
jgi:hypothetical protein